ncbi:MAG: thiamine-phosphate kinase [Candidatus Margulisiibacteriota bacterium]
MNASSSGEFELIRNISKITGKTSKNVIKGIGDDAAVIDTGGKKYLLAATDTIVESVHFDLKYYSFFDVGWKALAVNLSDIASMGGTPKYALVSLGLTKKTTSKNVLEIYEGMKKLAKQYSVDIIGGDTVLSPEKLAVTVSLIGEGEKNKVLYRKGAKVGDLIMVTGAFGGAALIPFPSPSGRGAVIASTRKITPSLLKRGGKGVSLAVVRVTPRINEGRVIAETGHATAMMDSSDGLGFTIGEICRQSGIGAQIIKSLIPRSSGASIENALYAGEDFELVFTCHPKFADIIAEKVCSACGTRISIIGKTVFRSKGINIDTKGFDHLR